MAIVALNTAATGLAALSTEIDVIAHNLANVNTTAFKRSRVNFEDLLYQRQNTPGSRATSGATVPSVTQVGLGVRVSNTQLDMSQGSLESTKRQLDVAIEGDGFFQVQIQDDIGTGTGYTRVGTFFINRDGQFVLGNSEGFLLEPAITVPADALDVTVGSDGTVEVTVPGSITPTTVGTIELARFVNDEGLQAIGSNIYVESEASGPPVTAVPGEGGAGTLVQEFLETSNVDPVRELVSLIKAQRAFELNSQSIQTADETLQVVGNLRRF